MKRNLIFNLRKQTLIFRTLVSFCIVLMAVGSTLAQQRITKTYEKEIEIPEGTVIRTEGPSIMMVSGHGRINTMGSSDEKYVVRRDNKSPLIYELDRRFQINTWDKNVVKQITEVTLACETEAQKLQLLDALKINLDIDASGQVRVRYEMNISKLQIENGWLRGDNNTIVLDNGQEYKLEYLKLSTTLFIPKKSHLKIEAEVSSIFLKDHEGKLDLNMSKGLFKTSAIEEAEVLIDGGVLQIDQFDIAKINSRHSEITIGKGNTLELTSELSNYLIREVDNIKAFKVINEKWDLGLINSLSVESGLFSEIKISSIEKNLALRLKNCDVSISRLSQNTEYVLIENQNAALDIGVGNLLNYQLNCKYAAQAKYNLPDNLLTLSKDDSEVNYLFGKKEGAALMDIRCKLCDVKIGQ